MTIRKTCASLLVAAATTLVGLALPAMANTSETTLSIGVPKPVVVRPLGGEPDNVAFSSVATNDIDAVLYTANPGQFGQHFTRDLANGLFSDLNGLKSSLTSQLTTVLASEAAVQSVNYLNIQANPIDLSIRQEGTAIGASLYGIRLFGSVEIDESAPGIPNVPLCTPTATFEIDVREVRSSYDVYTGNIQGTSVFYSVLDEDVDCDNILGDIILAVGGLFTDIDGQVSDRIEDVFDALQGSANAQQLFSVKDFLDGFRKVVQVDPVMIGDLFVTPAFSFNTDFIIDEAQDLILGTDLSSGLQLDLRVLDGSSNEIQFVVGHQELDVASIFAYSSQTVVTVDLPAQTKDVTIMACGSSGTCDVLNDIFSPVINGSTGAFRVEGTQVGKDIIAIADSNFISGLYSRPGKSIEVRSVSSCGSRVCN